MINRIIATCLFTSVFLGTAVASNAADYKGHKFRGRIVSVRDATISIRDDDAKLLKFVVIPETEIQRKEQPASLSDLQRDDVAVITGRREAARMVAVRVFVMPPE